VSGRYLAWRLFLVVPTVAGILVVGFVLVHLAPGDPVQALAGEHGDAEYYAFMRARFGLDQPLLAQFATFAANLLTGDFGRSFIQGRPAFDLVAERLPATLLLISASLALASVVGIALGIVAGSRPGGVRDLAVSGTTLALYAAPVFWIGQLVILLVAVPVGWLPVQGMTSPGSTSTGLAHALDVGRHLLLPALVLASQEVAAIARLTRTGLATELASDHVRTARAKGVAEWQVVGRHALRRALLPVVTVVGGRTGHLVAGTVVIETVFGWPGLGRLLVTSVGSGDRPVLLAIFAVAALAVVVVNLVTDLVYVRLDPRIRYR